MSYRDIVVHLTLDPRNAVRIQLAIGLARRFGARVSGLYTVPPPTCRITWANTFPRN